MTIYRNPETGETWDSETGILTQPSKKSSPINVQNADPIKSLVDDMGPVENALVGFGSGINRVIQGAKQRLGIGDQDQLAKDIAYSRKIDQPLTDTASGAIGNFAGTIAPAVPLSMIPGANTYAGSALIGGLMGATSPTLGNESTLLNTVMGASGGLAGKYLGDKVASALSSKLTAENADIAAKKVLNAQRDATLAKSQAAGYVVPPSQASTGAFPRMLEGLSGKFKTEQLARIKNQSITDNLVKKSIGVADDVPMTKDLLDTLRNQAGQSYDEVAKFGTINHDKPFSSALNKLETEAANLNKIKTMANPEFERIVDDLKNNTFDSETVLRLIKSLRADANANAQAIKMGNKSMPAQQEIASFQKKAAKELEGLLERNLKKNPNTLDLFKKWNQAKVQIAKIKTIEKALNESTGKVDAVRLAKASKGLATGDMKTVVDFATAFNKSAKMPDIGDANPLTVLDYFTGGAGVATSSPLVAMPAARVGARYGLLSRPFQQAFVKPDYSVNPVIRALGLLGREEAQSMAPLLGAYLSN